MARKARKQNLLDRFKTEDLGQIVAAILTALNRAEDGEPLRLTSRKQCQMIFLACEVLNESLARERREELKETRRTRKRQSKGI
jgi:hypothetical protein